MANYSKYASSEITAFVHLALLTYSLSEEVEVFFEAIYSSSQFLIFSYDLNSTLQGLTVSTGINSNLKLQCLSNISGGIERPSPALLNRF